jgi:superfamily II DNA or RNA helicase
MDTWLKINKLNESDVRITSNHPTIMGDLYSFFSVFVDGYFFMPKYKAGIWDGKVHFMEKNGKLPMGLIPQLCKFVKQDGLKIFMEPSLVERYDALPDLAEITNEWMTEKFVPYGYQVDGALAALKYGRCILEHATSAGKSLTMSMIIMYNLRKERARKILVLVPGISLVHQLASDFIEYGVPGESIGKYYGGEKDEDQVIIISTWQSMEKNVELCATFDMIIVDETHTVKANIIRKTIDNCINAKYRIGVTGTMPDKKADEWSILGAIGPVVHTITAKQLIEFGTASDILIRIPFLEYDAATKKKMSGLPYDLEKSWLESHDPRNEIIKKIIKKHIEKNQNALVLVEHIEHGELLYEKMKELEGAKVFFIQGSTDGLERERLRQFTNENEKVVLIATYGVFSTGVSIKRLHTILFASAGKSKIRTLQSIGRGLRLHKDKNKLLLYDIGDSLHNAEKHLETRIQIYTKAQFDVECFEIKVNPICL